MWTKFSRKTPAWWRYWVEGLKQLFTHGFLPTFEVRSKEKHPCAATIIRDWKNRELWRAF